MLDAVITPAPKSILVPRNKPLITTSSSKVLGALILTTVVPPPVASDTEDNKFFSRMAWPFRAGVAFDGKTFCTAFFKKLRVVSKTPAKYMDGEERLLKERSFREKDLSFILQASGDVSLEAARMSNGKAETVKMKTARNDFHFFPAVLFFTLLLNI